MKCFLAICMFVAVFAFIQADDTCTIEGKTIKVGETYSPPGKCEQITCNGPKSFVAKTCPSVATFEPCKYIPQDNTKPYPECCPGPECYKQP